jgi:hypothetical protein
MQRVELNPFPEVLGMARGRIDLDQVGQKIHEAPWALDSGYRTILVASRPLLGDF